MSTDPEHAAPKGANETLKCCPFCGSDSVSESYCTNVDNVVTGRFVECEDCAGCGPVYPSNARAIAAWNRRSQVQTPPSLEVMPEGLTDGLAQDEPISSRDELREAVARIIDPDLWATWDRMNSDPAYERPTWTANTSLTKADTILSLISPPKETV